MEMARSGGAGLPGNRRQVAEGVGFRNCRKRHQDSFSNV